MGAHHGPGDGELGRDTKGEQTHGAIAFLGQKRLRKYYGKIREVLEMPEPEIEVQKFLYDLFPALRRCGKHRQTVTAIQGGLSVGFPRSRDFK